MTQSFQIRKNSKQVIRVLRGPFEGLDITRLQLFYRDRETAEYKPGKTVAFNSELISAVIEGLVEMASGEPKVEIQPRSNVQAMLDPIYQILKGNRIAMHWEQVAEVLAKESPDIVASRWGVYNCLLSNPEYFTEVEEDVFQAVKRK